jgi:hypothetical protein
VIRRALGFFYRRAALDAARPKPARRCVHPSCGTAWTTDLIITTPAGPMCVTHMTAEQVAEFERKAGR